MVGLVTSCMTSGITSGETSGITNGDIRVVDIRVVDLGAELGGVLKQSIRVSKSGLSE